MDTGSAKWLSLCFLYAFLVAYLASEANAGDDLSSIISKSIPNTFSTIAALAAGAWITLAIIEQALKDDKRKLSEKVRDKTYFEIIDNVTEISSSVFVSLPYGLTQEERKQIESFLETIRNKTRNYKKDGKSAAEAIGEFSVLLTIVRY